MGTYILVNLINLYALPIAALLGSITTLFILSYILIKRSGISLKEIVLSFNFYELVLFISAIFLGYFVVYPSNLSEALVAISYTLIPFSILVLLGKKFRTFLSETYMSYIKKTN